LNYNQLILEKDSCYSNHDLPTPILLGGPNGFIRSDHAILVVIAFSAHAQTDCTAVTEIPTAQCETLVALYDSTNGDNWKTNTGWKQTNTPCSWHGVTCSDGDVIQIVLSSNQLTGTIPDFSALTNLQYLYISQNSLTGPIPDFSALTNLLVLYLTQNQLTGSIPDLNALTNLQQLYLNNNQLTSSIPDISILIKLKYLSLSNNQLTGTIPDFSALTNLQILSLGNNPELCKDPNTDYGQWTTIVSSFAECQANLCDTVTEIPKTQCETLVALYDSTNGDDWSNKAGWLQNDTPCRWHGISCNQGSVTDMDLDNNNLTGSLPDLSALVNLQKIWVSYNNLNGSMPALSSLTQLEIAHFNHNAQLSGNMPSLMGLTELVEFSISQDNLTGPISNLGPLTKLLVFTIDNNQLTGPIPSLDQLTALQTLSLGGNALCQDSFADYAGRPEVAEFPLCPHDNEPPIAVFTAIPQTGTLTVNLDASLSSDANGQIVTYQWRSDDGQTATGVNAQMTFNQAGLYTISLTVTDNHGMTNVNTAQQTVNVGQVNVPTVPLMLRKRGAGNGSLYTLDDSTPKCDQTCDKIEIAIAQDSVVMIGAVAAEGSKFREWSGACKGTEPTTTVTMSKKKNCIAYFDLEATLPNVHPLEINRIDSGNGRVKVKLARDIMANCYTFPCEAGHYATDTEITLIATASNGSKFVGWSGTCNGNETTTTVTIAQATDCEAQFELLEPPPGLVSLEIKVFGGGAIEGNGINCGDQIGDCAENIALGRRIKLTAKADPFFHFQQWSANCGVANPKDPTISIKMDSNKQCTAIFGDDADIWAQETTKELYEIGQLNTGEKISLIYPPPLNEGRLWELFRLAENALTKVEQHLLVTQQWPELFHGIEWYSPMPETFYVKSIQIISGTEMIGDYSVAGDYVRVDVVLVNNDSEEEWVPILVYYNENTPPIIQLAPNNLRRSPRRWRHFKRIISYFRRGWRW
jgi:Leucine-rich repeat (LRR) protein/PKD repeat protein